MTSNAKQPKIVYLGTPDFAVAPLKALVEKGYNILAAVTNPDRPVGRKQILTPPPVKLYAQSVGIPVYQYNKIRAEGVADIKALAPDLMITCAFGQILSQELLDIPPLGVYNIHGSLLPKFRGASPIQAAVLAGEKETGVTVMKTDIGVDTGDMLLQKSLPVGRHTSASLFSLLSDLGAEAILEAMPLILAGNPELQKQQESLATHTKMIKKEQAEICWNQTVDQIDCFVRGMYDWPVAFTHLNGEVVKILEGEPLSLAHTEQAGAVVSADKRGIIVACKTDAFLIKRLQFTGGKPLTAADAVNGRKVEPGMIFGAQVEKYE